MAKHKDFTSLFGGDDSDEENLQSEFSSGSGKDKLKSVSENKYKEREKNDKSSNDKHIKRLKSSTDDQNKKKVKTDHENDNKIDQKTTEIVIESAENNHKVGKPPDIKEKHNGAGKTKVRLKKTEIGGLVVKLLTPAYVDKRFESRETFKTLARNISHALFDKGNKCFFLLKSFI